MFRGVKLAVLLSISFLYMFISAAQDKMRVLYLVTKYPEFSETYMHEEMMSIYKDYEVKIINYELATAPRKNHLPYTFLELEDVNFCHGFIYQPLGAVNLEFTNPGQKKLLQEIGGIIEEFKPYVIHIHYFCNSYFAKKLAELYHVPFTIRTHSFDMLNVPEEKMKIMCEAASSPWCAKVFTYPRFKDVLLRHGLPEDKIAVSWPIVNVKRFYRPEKRSRTGKVLCVGPCIKKKAHKEFIDLAYAMRDRGLQFDLYTKGNQTELIKKYNGKKGNPATIKFAEPEEMAEVYPQYDWLVYTSDKIINKVGLPAGIIEAQASGIGVCWQELPGRREEQLEFLGGAGILFNSIKKVPEIISKPYPEKMRLIGLENAKKCDADDQKIILTQVWDSLNKK